jgi:AcrR family transcriptional regulator
MPRPSKRNDIIEAATVLFGKHAYAEVSIRDIAKEAKVQPMSVYRLFQSKELIFEECLRAITAEAAELRMNFLNSDAPPKQKIKSTVFHALRDRDRLKIHRKIMLRAVLDEDMSTISFLIEAQKERVDLAYKAFKELGVKKDTKFIFFSVVSLVLSYGALMPIFDRIDSFESDVNDLEALTEKILHMVLPEVRWKSVKVLHSA